MGIEGPIEDFEAIDYGAAAHAPKDIAGLGAIEQGGVTLEPEVVLKAVPILKMNWAFAFLAAFSLSVPLRAAVVAKL